MNKKKHRNVKWIDDDDDATDEIDSKEFITMDFFCE